MQKFTIHRKESGLFSDLSNVLTYDQESLSNLLSAPFSAKAFDKQIQLKETFFTPEKRALLANVLQEQYAGFPQSDKVNENIASLRDPDTFTVTTGHQLNLLTGPVYFIYKILHTIRLAEELSLQYPSKKIVPVYWMASEDHDFEEINHTSLFGKRISWEEKQDGPVGRYELNNWADLKDTVAAFFQNQPDSEVNEVLRTYTGKNLSEATKSLVHTLFGKYGLIIVEPDHHLLKKAFAPVMQQEVTEHFAEKAVQESNTIIESLGYKPQVFAREINLFFIRKGLRERLVPENGKISIQGEGTFSVAEILEQIAKNPENFSPNVVLRPVYQECILPNLAYIGGGGEIAYWLQFKGVFDACGIPYPLIQVRNSIQIIDQNTQKKMSKTGISAEDLFKDLDELKKEYVLRNAGESLDFSTLDNLATQLTEQMTAQIIQSDSGLQSYAFAEAVKIQKQLESVKSKLIKQQKTQFDSAMKQLEDIKSKMFPHNHVQERTDNFFSFCAGGEVYSLLENLKSAIDPFEKDLILLNLD